LEVAVERNALGPVELAHLDALITAAQARGLGPDDRVTKTQDQADAQMDIHEAMWEARHGGLELSEQDREVVAQIRQLAGRLEIAPTLGQLIELRAEAVRSLNM
jgi:uncharacterized cupin superfamily protein